MRTTGLLNGGYGRLPLHAMTLLCPRLRELAPAERRFALARAREIEFDALERAGLVGAVAFVAWLLRGNGISGGDLTLAVFLIEQFLLAVPLLIVVSAPFFLRRTRRGLERELERRSNRSGSERQGARYGHASRNE